MATGQDVPVAGRADEGAGPPRDPWLRWTALAGVATLPLALAAGLLTDPNAYADVHPGSSDRRLLETFGEMTTPLAWGSALQAVAALCLWLFLAPLWARLRNGSQWLALLAVVGGSGVGLVLLFSSGLSTAAGVAVDHGDADALRLLFVAGWENARVAVAPAFLMVLATTLAGLRHQSFGAGVTVLGCLFTGLLAAGLLPGTPGGLAGLAVHLWVLVVALALVVGGPRRGSGEESGLSPAAAPRPASR